MYVLKQKPEDFIVEERTNIQPKQKGDYSLWWMKKKNLTTLEATTLIADKMNMKSRFVGFAGTKDKNAITKQLISISRMPKNRIENIKIEGIQLEFYGYSDNPISLGDLEGNSFEINVRNLDKPIKPENKKIKNYFGEQRFSEQNETIGKAIIKKDFKTAANMIAETNPETKYYLEQNITDYIGAIRKMPLKILKLYVHAYQSLMWNKIAEQLTNDTELPIIGFDTEIKDQKIKSIIETIMTEEQISYRDFIIKAIPELSSEGGIRSVFINPTEFEIIETTNDELNIEKYKTRIKFYLPKSSYATETIKQLFT